MSDAMRATPRSIVTRILWAAVALGEAASPASARAEVTHSERAKRPSAARAAEQLVAVTRGAARRKLLQPFSEAARSDWHYVPRERVGLAYREMTPAQRRATEALLRTAVTARGLAKLHAVMQLEIVLRELEGSGAKRDPENYSIALFGTPAVSGAPWGFRLEGHHLSLHFTVRDDRFVSTLPQFFGSNPRRVPRSVGHGAPPESTRVLATEEDLARGLMQSLPPDGRAVAHFDDETYGDIVSRNAARLSPLSPVGIAFSKLSPSARSQLLRLIGAFAEHLRPELSQARMARVRRGGRDSIRFGWAGSLEPNKPFYYRIQGKGFLIEVDDSGGNHIHTVWRDFDGDWGRDTLAEHYEQAPHDHRHARPEPR